MPSAGEKTLKFLLDLCIVEGKLHPIGEKGWYNRNNYRAFFDQQPIDSSSIVQALLTAYRITKNKEYYFLITTRSKGSICYV